MKYPTPTTNAKPNAPLCHVTAAALEAEKEWRTAESKATRPKVKAAMGDKRRMEMVRETSLMKQNGEPGMKPYQLMTNDRYDGRTWADVIWSGGINVQIVLGNGNLG
jgi:hypothetical protein